MPITKTKNKDSQPIDKTIYGGDVKIGKDGVQWEKKSFWITTEQLNKLKVISHFDNKSVDKIVNKILKEYTEKKLANSMAIKKLVSQSKGKVVKGSS